MNTIKSVALHCLHPGITMQQQCGRCRRAASTVSQCCRSHLAGAECRARAQTAPGEIAPIAAAPVDWRCCRAIESERAPSECRELHPGHPAPVCDGAERAVTRTGASRGARGDEVVSDWTGSTGTVAQMKGTYTYQLREMKCPADGEFIGFSIPPPKWNLCT